MRPLSPVAFLLLGSLCLMSLTPHTDALGLKKGLKILAPLAIIGGAAGAGGLAGALLGSRHKHHPVHHHVKHIHYHPIHHVKYVHHEPIHHVKVIEKHVDHGWHDDGWHGDIDGGWHGGFELDGGHGGWW